MKGMEGVVAAIHEALDERVSGRTRLVKQVKALDVEIRHLRQAERVLSATTAGKQSMPGSNVAAVEEVMRKLKTATQSEVAKRIGKPKNTAKAALEALAARGIVQATGEFDRRSPKFTLVQGGEERE